MNKKSEHAVAQEAVTSSADQLIGEFKSLMADAEALIKNINQCKTPILLQLR